MQVMQSYRVIQCSFFCVNIFSFTVELPVNVFSDDSDDDDEILMGKIIGEEECG